MRLLAMQTAVALADFEPKTDEEGRILLKDTHIMQVVQMSRQFRDYLTSLHEGDESERAEREGIRNDGFDKYPGPRDDRDRMGGHRRGGSDRARWRN